MLLATSCSVRNYNSSKPFPYRTTINLVGKTPEYDRLELQTKLQDQVDDSLKTRLISSWVFFRALKNPPVFDSLNIGRSKIFITNLLHSLGYFNPVVQDTFYIDTVANKQHGEQKRVYTTFTVTPGIAMRLDSIGYALETPELQALALKSMNGSLLKKGEPYSDQKVNGELDRLLAIYRDSGYYKFSKENIYAERDTVVAALIDPTLDPFEQLRLLDSLSKKREKPTINITIRQRPLKDSAHIRKFYMGNVRVYPDLSILEDSVPVTKDSATIQGYQFFFNSRRFKLPFIATNIRLRPGTAYSQRRYYRVINTFNQLGAWQNVDLTLQERYDSVPLLDAVLRLYPAMKHSLNVDFETSRNVSDFLSQGTYFGLGLNFRLLNRNAYREAIQTSTNARFGIEIGTHLVQTLQASLSHNIYFPKIILPKFLLDWFPRKTEGNERTLARRTVLNLTGAYTDRRDFFRAPSFNTSWGYEWTRRKTRASDPDNATQRWTKSYVLTPFNFEYTDLHKTDSLRKLEEAIPAYRFAFNDGMIISTVFSATAARQFDNDKRLVIIRGRIEESGALFGLIKSLELGDLRRFVKVDAEVKHYINRKRSSWAFRAFGGVAFIYGKTDTNGVIVKEHNLPFFKAFFAGGPYSMRAWQVRRLGPGSSTIYDTSDTTRVDRFGNMQLEFNAEYRFNITTIAGVKVNSALFVDIGNIWSKEYQNGQEVPEASFKLSRLYKDIALGAGTSLRLDFEFFMIRLDWAYRLKNPRYANMNYGWFQKIDIASGQLQLGIGYPF
ncbi:BamA/TamA family outer membrane protein [Paraflavitalea soli]|nr:BamA/TamA family outer membrane protein [Paraflavitalea soli]